MKEYVGGYDDWQRQRPQEVRASKASFKKHDAQPARKPSSRLKLGFKQQKELDSLPDIIEGLEREQHGLFEAMGDSALYKKDRADIVAANDRLGTVKELLAHAYARWEELEQIRLDGENNTRSG